jgi:hypothetical protein
MVSCLTCGLLLVAGVWSSFAEEQWLRGTPKPTAWPDGGHWRC